QAVDVAYGVAEFQRIGDRFWQFDTGERVFVEGPFQAFDRRAAHVMAAIAAYAHAGDEVFGEDHALAAGTLAPEIFRHITPSEQVANFRADDFGQPTHAMDLVAFDSRRIVTVMVGAIRFGDGGGTMLPLPVICCRGTVLELPGKAESNGAARPPRRASPRQFQHIPGQDIALNFVRPGVDRRRSRLQEQPGRIEFLTALQRTHASTILARDVEHRFGDALEQLGL